VELPKGHTPLGEARFWMRVPSGRTAMLTTIANPIARALEMEIELNGRVTRSSIPGMSTRVVETPLSSGEGSLAIALKGDRRLVVMETDFR